MRRRKSSSISRSSSSAGAVPFDGAAAATTTGIGRSESTRDARRDLDEPDEHIGEAEQARGVIDEDRALAVQRPQIRAADDDVGRLGQLEEVGEQGLLVVEVQDGVVDHAAMVPRQRRYGEWPDGPVYGW